MLTAVILGVWAAVFSTALMNGLLQERFRTAIENEWSHLQIHHPKYTAESEVQHFISEPREVIDFLEKIPAYQNHTTRVLTRGMITSSATSSGAEIIGVDPNRELAMTHLDEFITGGTWFDLDRKNELIIGERMRKKLNLSLRSRVVLNFQNMEGDITSAAFRIAGFYRTQNGSADEVRVYTRQSDIQELLNARGVVHEIAVLIDDLDSAEEICSQVNKFRDDILAQSWYELSPEMRFMVGGSDFYIYIFLTIILLGLGFGIFNTIMMVVFERTRELGMLLALGMNKLRVFLMLVLEILIISLMGGIFGVVVAVFFVEFFRERGIELGDWGEGMAEFGYGSVIYPQLEPVVYLNTALIVLLIAVVSSIYPGIKAIGLQPAEAIIS